MLGLNTTANWIRKSSRRVDDISSEPTPLLNFVIFRYQSAGRTWKLSGMITGGRMICGELVYDVTPISEFCEATRYWYPVRFNWKTKAISASNILEYV